MRVENTKNNQEHSLVSAADLPSLNTTSGNNIWVEDFLPFNPEDPRLISEIRVEARSGHTEKVKTRHFKVRYLDANEVEVKAAEIHSLGIIEHQDAVDTLVYGQDDSGYKIAIYQAIRPVLPSRHKASDATLVGNEEYTGLLWSLPATNLRIEEGHAGVEDAGKKILKQKIGINLEVTSADLEFLGGSYFTSIGGTTESCRPVALRVPLPPDLQRIKFGETFHANVLTKFEDFHQALQSCLNGTYHDLRLLAHLLRFARYKGIEVPALGILSQNKIQKERALHPAVAKRMLTQAAVRKLIDARHLERQSIQRVEVSETSAPSEPFVETEVLDVTMYNKMSTTIGTFSAEAMRRRGQDCVDIGAWFFHNDALYLAINRGPRPGVAARELFEHPVSSPCNHIHIDGISGMLPKQDITLQTVFQTAAATLKRETGLSGLGAAQYLTYAYTSPTYDKERTYLVLQQIDPSQIQEEAADEIYFVKAQDILALAEQGYIRDQRLEIFAHLLALEGEKANQKIPRQLSAVELEFLQLINSASPIQAYLSKHCQEVDAELSRFAEYRNAKIYLENERGLIFVPSTETGDVNVFRSAFARFDYDENEDQNKLPFSLDHDLRHWAAKDLCPYLIDKNRSILHDSHGDPLMLPRDQFRRALTVNECFVGWHSDVILPSQYDLHKADLHKAKKITWRGKVAQAFEVMGLSKQEALNAILSIEGNGIIPAKILKHARYQEFRDVIVDRYLRFHVLDQLQSDIIYNNWQKHAWVAQVMIRFCDVHTDVQDYYRGLRESMQMLKKYAEGRNRFKQEIALAKASGVQNSAIRIASLMEYMCENRNVGYEKAYLECEKWLERLYEALLNLEDIHARIKNTELNDENIALYRRYKRINNGLIKPARDFIKGLSERNDLFTSAQLAQAHSRELFFLEDLKIRDEAAIRARLDELEQRSITRLTP